MYQERFKSLAGSQPPSRANLFESRTLRNAWKERRAVALSLAQPGGYRQKILRELDHHAKHRFIL